MTPSLLAFIYFILATPFLTWAVFRYNGFKAQKIYIKELESDISSATDDIEEITATLNDLSSEVNSLKIKAGFSGKKSFLN